MADQDNNVLSFQIVADATDLGRTLEKMVADVKSDLAIIKSEVDEANAAMKLASPADKPGMKIELDQMRMNLAQLNTQSLTLAATWKEVGKAIADSTREINAFKDTASAKSPSGFPNSAEMRASAQQVIQRASGTLQNAMAKAEDLESKLGWLQSRTQQVRQQPAELISQTAPKIAESAVAAEKKTTTVPQAQARVEEKKVAAAEKTATVLQAAPPAKTEAEAPKKLAVPVAAVAETPADLYNRLLAQVQALEAAGGKTPASSPAGPARPRTPREEEAFQWGIQNGEKFALDQSRIARKVKGGTSPENALSDERTRVSSNNVADLQRNFGLDQESAKTLRQQITESIKAQDAAFKAYQANLSPGGNLPTPGPAPVVASASALPIPSARGNQFDQLLAKLKAGDLTEGGAPSRLLSAAKPAFEAGAIATSKDLREWIANEYPKVPFVGTPPPKPIYSPASAPPLNALEQERTNEARRNAPPPPSTTLTPQQQQALHERINARVTPEAPLPLRPRSLEETKANYEAAIEQRSPSLPGFRQEYAAARVEAERIAAASEAAARAEAARKQSLAPLTYPSSQQQALNERINARATPVAAPPRSLEETKANYEAAIEQRSPSLPGFRKEYAAARVAAARAPEAPTPPPPAPVLPPRYQEAHDFARGREDQKLSTSALQRELGVKYAHAQELIQALEDQGVVSSAAETGKNRPRRVNPPEPEQAPVVAEPRRQRSLEETRANYQLAREQLSARAASGEEAAALSLETFRQEVVAARADKNRPRRVPEPEQVAEPSAEPPLRQRSLGETKANYQLAREQLSARANSGDEAAALSLETFRQQHISASKQAAPPAGPPRPPIPPPPPAPPPGEPPYEDPNQRKARLINERSQAVDQLRPASAAFIGNVEQNAQVKSTRDDAQIALNAAKEHTDSVEHLAPLERDLAQAELQVVESDKLLAASATRVAESRKAVLEADRLATAAGAKPITAEHGLPKGALNQEAAIYRQTAAAEAEAIQSVSDQQATSSAAQTASVLQGTTTEKEAVQKGAAGNRQAQQTVTDSVKQTTQAEVAGAAAAAAANVAWLETSSKMENAIKALSQGSRQAFAEQVQGAHAAALALDGEGQRMSALRSQNEQLQNQKRIADTAAATAQRNLAEATVWLSKADANGLKGAAGSVHEYAQAAQEAAEKQHILAAAIEETNRLLKLQQEEAKGSGGINSYLQAKTIQADLSGSGGALAGVLARLALQTAALQPLMAAAFDGAVVFAMIEGVVDLTKWAYNLAQDWLYLKKVKEDMLEVEIKLAKATDASYRREQQQIVEELKRSGHPVEAAQQEFKNIANAPIDTEQFLSEKEIRTKFKGLPQDLQDGFRKAFGFKNDDMELPALKELQGRIDLTDKLKTQATAKGKEYRGYQATVAETAQYDPGVPIGGGASSTAYSHEAEQQEVAAKFLGIYEKWLKQRQREGGRDLAASGANIQEKKATELMRVTEEQVQLLRNTGKYTASEEASIWAGAEATARAGGSAYVKVLDEIIAKRATAQREAARQSTEFLRNRDQQDWADREAAGKVSLAQEIRWWEDRLTLEKDNSDRKREIGLTLGHLYQRRDTDQEERLVKAENQQSEGMLLPGSGKPDRQAQIDYFQQIRTATNPDLIPPAPPPSTIPMATAGTDLPGFIAQTARKNDIDPGLALAVAENESGTKQFKKDGSIVQSSTGALGVMQLQPGTAKEMGVNPYDATQNVQGGVGYLGKMLAKYVNPERALEAYNWGEGRVDRGEAMPDTVKDYAKNILARSKTIAVPAAQASQAPEFDQAPDHSKQFDNANAQLARLNGEAIRDADQELVKADKAAFEKLEDDHIVSAQEQQRFWQTIVGHALAGSSELERAEEQLAASNRRVLQEEQRVRRLRIETAAIPIEAGFKQQEDIVRDAGQAGIRPTQLAGATGVSLPAIEKPTLGQTIGTLGGAASAATEEARELQAIHLEEVEDDANTLAKERANAGDNQLLLAEIDKKAAVLQAKYNREKLQDSLAVAKAIEAQYKETVTQITSNFFKGLNEWMEGQKSFAQAMKDSWNDIVKSIISDIEKMVEKWLVEKVVLAGLQKIWGALTNPTTQQAGTSGQSQQPGPLPRLLTHIPVIGPALGKLISPHSNPDDHNAVVAANTAALEALTRALGGAVAPGSTPIASSGGNGVKPGLQAGSTVAGTEANAGTTLTRESADPAWFPRGLIRREPTAPGLTPQDTTNLGDFKNSELGQLAGGAQFKQAGQASQQETNIVLRDDQKQIQGEKSLTQATTQATKQDLALETRGDQQKLGTALKVDKEVVTDAKNAVRQIDQAMLVGVNQWISGQKSFGQAMKSTWNSMAMSVITDIEQIAVKWVEEHIIMAAIEKLFHASGASDEEAGKTKTIASNVATATSDAGTAAAGTLAYYSAFAPEIAPVMAAAQLAIGMGFAGLAAVETGGFIPSTGVALLHQGEIVVNHPVTQMLSQLAASGNSYSDRSTSATAGAVHNHIHYSPTIHATGSAPDIKQLLSSHADHIGRLVQQQSRKFNR